MAGQTLRMHRQPREKWDDFMRRRGEQVQGFADSQHRRGFGEQALFSYANYASYISHIARHHDTGAITMLNPWQPDHYEAAWRTRLHACREAHRHGGEGPHRLHDSPRACGEGLRPARWHTNSQTTPSPECAAYAADAMCGSRSSRDPKPYRRPLMLASNGAGKHIAR